jgi:hypothetical protein
MYRASSQLISDAVAKDGEAQFRCVATNFSGY